MRRSLAPLLGWQSSDRDEAWSRAESLLRDSLRPEQYEAYQHHGYLEVHSKMHVGRTYRVDGWRPVAVFDNGRFSGAICLRPKEQLPGPDVVLARKLLIEGAEEEFLRSGNWLSPAWRPASTAPTLLLMLILLTPWLAHLLTFGAAGAAATSVVVLVPLVLLFVLVRRRRGA